jgi:N-acetylneuraminic acid mutarotase
LRWQELAAMPTARSGLAVAVYENMIYTIGGETAHGVTGVMEQYDVATDSWTTLKPKPVPVTDINAAVIGGKIYIPGGRLASGGMTDVLESYDPSRNLWEKHAALPIVLSGYALAAFEGKLYVFGGWDGQKSLASVYEYDPEQDRWRSRFPMPTARAFAGAAIAGGSIYVIGGTAGGKALAVNEEYIPEHNTGATNPWTARSPIPGARSAMGMTSIADVIFAVGGMGDTGSILPSLQYSYQLDQWKNFENPPAPEWSYLALAPLQSKLYVLGGRQNGVSVSQNLSYQAIYTIEIPIAP